MSDLETVGDVMRDAARRAVLRAKALRYVTRTGNADVAEALGLVDPGPPVRRPCPDCGHPLPDPVTNGGHKPCQRRACKAARAEGGAR
jgi:hypothetical protein